MLFRGIRALDLLAGRPAGDEARAKCAAASSFDAAAALLLKIQIQIFASLSAADGESLARLQRVI